MNPFLSFIIRTSVALPTAFIVLPVSFFAFGQTLLLSSAISVGGGAVAFLGTGVYTKHRFLKKHQLTRKEYVYIKKNLKEAKPKIARLNKSLFKIRHIPSLKERIDVLRVTRKIYRLTKMEPKRFYKAEPFYFSHLDSILELTEKYAFLASQPKKNHELELSLNETRRTLSELAQILENDLHQVISDDIDHLNFEIDVAKNTINTLKK
ncbi:5-bromo-4-chloroindolyl phosphate hydrolysis family protein [Bacillus sp. CGMCC 1.16607]|uniref:5-bromo-4-chloroindolyl phosphate hydrolysis family protein n=1 Tax=Bacillus sp. CGMCC 1.16607 TaxID=3351842 RepID=UPI00362EC1BC